MGATCRSFAHILMDHLFILIMLLQDHMTFIYTATTFGELAASRRTDLLYLPCRGWSDFDLALSFVITADGMLLSLSRGRGKSRRSVEST